MTQRDDVIREAKAGDRTKAAQAHSELCKSYESSGLNPPESFDWFMSVYGPK